MNSRGRTLRLDDGRQLGYAEYGDPRGKTLFYFNGTPGSRIEARLADVVAESAGIRLIGTDRPGYGLSDFKPGRRFTDWPDDVVELAQALHIERFGVLGFSGGGPHVAACALRIPQRLTVAAIVSCSVPSEARGTTERMPLQRRLLHSLAQRLPWLERFFMWNIALTARRFPGLMISQMGAMMAEPDRAVLARPEVRALFVDNFVEAFRRGTRGATYDLSLVARPWGFDLGEIAAEIHLWHGELDTNAGPVVSKALLNCHATLLPGEGHLLLWNHTEEILRRLSQLMMA